MALRGEVGPHFRDRSWAYAYKTSTLREDGSLVDILHEFYIPVLERSESYDRVAGYFTSSSLAAASQGYSAFTAHGGRMRLIVGADMDPRDVAAVLSGEEARLERHLESELEGTWPEDVSRGIELLAWMVSQGFLELRVAFRLHGKTSEPLPFESQEDGYVHEKWALFRDKAGHRILASGSLNESKTALVHNAENLTIDCDWWEGPSADRIGDHQKDFDALWEDRHPHFRVLTLPEAVHRKLVRMGERVRIPREVDGTPRKIPPKPTPEEWLAFKVVQMAPKMPGGLWVGMETAPVSPWPHQEVVARRLIENWPSSFMLCDEVGLGKTIEAGLALRSLILSGVVKRVLVASPAGLTRQWHREMATKFYLPFRRGIASPVKKHELLFPDHKWVQADNLFEPDLCILSTGLLVREERLPELSQAEPFDVVLLDEAHYARRKDPNTENSCRSDPSYGRLYRTLQENLGEKAEALWLATATPVQMDWIEAYDLFRLCERVGAFGESPSLVRAYYEALGKLGRNEPLKTPEWELLKRAIERIQEEDPWLWNYLRNGIIQGRVKTILEDWLQENRTPRKADYAFIRRLLFAAAPLSRVMLRHTRKLLELYKAKGQLRENLAIRKILPIPRIVFTSDEQTVYDGLQEYCQELARKIEESGTESERRASLGFYLSFLRQRCSSSFYALQESLKRRKQKVERTLLALGVPPEETDDFNPEEQDQDTEDNPLDKVLENRSPEDLQWECRAISEILGLLETLTGIPSKTKELLKQLDGRRNGSRIKQTVLFTRYLDTLNDLLRTLQRQAPEMRLGVYSGQYCAYYDESRGKIASTDPEDVKKRFLRGEVDVLLCTDAAAEGLNLQTADLLVNYDLPWNPMKVEQRVGRIDRIGQRHEEIFVLNLCMLDSVEEVIYGRLLNRLQIAQEMTGSIPFSLLPLIEEDFDAYAAGKITQNKLEELAKERMERQKRQIEAMEVPPEELYDFYQKLSKQRRSDALPVTLESIWSLLANCQYLRELGCEIVPGTDGHVLRLAGIPGIPKGSCLTGDRETFEKGVPGLDSVLHLATYLDPVFDRLVEAVLEAAKPPVSVETLVLEGYRPVEALVVKTEEGERLVTGLADLKGLRLVDEKPDEEKRRTFEIEIKARLKEIEGNVAAYERPIHNRIMKINETTAKTQRWLEWFVAYSYLESLAMVGVADDDLFAGVVPSIDQRLAEKSVIHVIDMETEPLKRMSEVFFELDIPELGQRATIAVPAILCKAGLDSACREAEALLKDYKKNEITVKLVKERLRRRFSAERVL